MKFEIEKKDFMNALNSVKGSIHKINTIEILGHFMVNAEGGAITITGTNLNIEIKRTVIAEVETDGRATFHAHKVISVVSKLSDDKPIKVELDGGFVIIKQGRSRIRLPSLSIDDFLTLPDSDVLEEFKIHAHDLRDLMAHTHFTASTDDMKHYLNGVYVHTEGNAMVAVSTDGVSLSKYSIGWDGTSLNGITLPNGLVSEMMKLIADIDQDVVVTISQGIITIDMDSAIIKSRKIDGTYPDYKRMMPPNNTSILHVSQSDLKAALDMAAIFSDRINNRIKFSIKSNGVAVSTEQGDSFNAVDGIFTGEDMDTFYSAHHILNIISRTKGELVLSFNDGMTAVIIEPAEDQGAMYLLAPQGQRTS